MLFSQKKINTAYVLVRDVYVLYKSPYFMK